MMSIEKFKCSLLFLACGLSDILHESKKLNPLLSDMKSDVRALKASLLKRELELQRLIRQMKFDQLHHSPVYKNLELELDSVKSQLTLHAMEDVRK
jgi:hypothetical protein